MKSKRIVYIANLRFPTEIAHGVLLAKMAEASAKGGPGATLLVPRRKNRISADPFAYYAVSRAFEVRWLWCLDTVTWGKFGFIIESLSFAASVLWYALTHPRAAAYYSYDHLPLLFLKGFGFGPLYEEVHVEYDGLLRRIAARVCAGIVVVSEGFRSKVESWGIPSERVLVVPNGISESLLDAVPDPSSRARLSLPSDRTLIAYVGKYKTLGASKGVDELVRAVARIRHELPEATVLLVGLNDSEFPLLRDVGRAAGLPEDSLLLVGHVQHARALEYMRAADILVLNYPRTPHYELYMSPMKLFEYMASGVPIVTTDLASVREVIGKEEAELITPSDEEALVSALRRLISDPVHARMLTVNAKQRVRQYTWECRARRIHQFIGIGTA